ncbi:MAG TPA: serine hydrolase, partial [Clostridium sp.]|nr:serine hydrolase [Clostridium sp.]
DEMPKLMSKYNIPGASIGIVEEGKIQEIYNYGMANKKDKVMVDDNTVFQVASISKSITS